MSAAGMDLGLRDRVVMLVGASNGIGAATARTLALNGARLTLVARRAEALAELAVTLVAEGAQPPLELALDAGMDGALDEAVTRTLEHFGALHGLAVIAGPMGPRGTVEALTNADWRHYFDQGLMIAVQACRAVLPAMRQQRAGTIVTTSAYSIRAQKPSLVAYTAAKAAIASLTKNLAKSYGADGIRANCIAPGVVEKDDSTTAEWARRHGVAPEQARYQYVKREFQMSVALERAGRHAEFADVIAFLLSDRASYVTGATLNVDGGTDF